MFNNTIDLSPESKRLREQYDNLKLEFAELFQKKDYMLSFEEDLLTALYLELIGQKQYELFCLQTEVGSLRMKQQLIQAALNRDEKPDLASIEKKIKKAFSSYYKQIEQQMKDLAKAREFLSKPVLSEEEVEEIKKLYRLLVKRLHPDLNPSLTQQGLELFYQVQTAYKLCDLNRLREYTLLIETSLEEMKNNVGDTLIIKQIETLEKQITELKDQIKRLDGEFPFAYRILLLDKDWIESQQAQLTKEIELYEKEKLRLLDIIDLQLS